MNDDNPFRDLNLLCWILLATWLVLVLALAVSW